MKLLITGAQGQLGTDMTRLARAGGHEAIPLGSRDLDISDFRQVMDRVRQEKPDAIINCAAYNAVDQAETDWERAFEVNGLGPKYLARAASDTGATLIHYSTDYIFDGKTNRPYTLADTPAPLGRYGESKLLGEQLVMRHAEHYYVIRVSWVFGAGNVNFPAKVLGWSETTDTITVVDDQSASPAYTGDLASASLDLLNSEQYGLFHMTNAGYCSRFEWARYILNKAGWEGELVPGKSADFPTPATRPTFSALDTFGTRQAIGYDLPPWQDATDRFLHEIGRI